jgi:hypothetical protein
MHFTCITCAERGDKEGCKVSSGLGMRMGVPDHRDMEERKEVLHEDQCKEELHEDQCEEEPSIVGDNGVTPMWRYSRTSARTRHRHHLHCPSCSSAPAVGPLVVVNTSLLLRLEIAPNREGGINHLLHGEGVADLQCWRIMISSCRPVGRGGRHCETSLSLMCHPPGMHVSSKTRRLCWATSCATCRSRHHCRQRQSYRFWNLGVPQHIKNILGVHK